jgi:hypothetical protein
MRSPRSRNPSDPTPPTTGCTTGALFGSGQKLGLPQNLPAWALANARRGRPLYPLAGPIVVTGRITSGDLTAPEADLVQQAKAVAQTLRDALGEWRARPPASNEAAVNELLAYTARDVASRGQ